MKKRIIIGIILAIAITGGIILFTDNDEKCNDSALKFKETYEKYNNTKEKLTIKDDNPMVAIKKENIITKIDKGNGVIFFGTPKENESRLVVKNLLEVSKDYNCEVIYYYDLTNLDKESDIYKELSSKLGDNELKNGIVIFHKNGEVVECVEYNKNTKEMKLEIDSGFSAVNNGMCEVAKQC
jgi:hypothetical protein